MMLATRLLRFYSQPRSELAEYAGLVLAEFMIRQKENDLIRFAVRAENASINKGRYELLATMIAKRVSKK